VQAPERALRQAQRMKAPGQTARQALIKQLAATLEKRGLKSGRMLEISGAWDKSYERGLPGFKTDYVEIFPKKGDPSVYVADAINLAHVESETYDVVISHAVLEHVNKPWLAAREIERVLKIGGVTQHNVPFSMPFHGAPHDYFRYTTSGLRSLFDGLECLYAAFRAPNRRVNIRGTRRKANFVSSAQQSPEFAEDAFGGWRETWHCVFAGAKVMDCARMRARNAASRLTIDCVYAMLDKGLRGPEIFAGAHELISRVALDQEGRLFPRSQVSDAEPPPTAAEIEEHWRKSRKSDAHGFSHIRFLLRNHLV
jgi:SAM-dependent methyltransferase